MYIEMVDETGQVSEEILKQTQEILEFAAQKTGKEKKEMSVAMNSTWNIEIPIGLRMWSA